MELLANEIEFLATWAKEEKAPDPYDLPAHRLLAIHQIPSVALIRAIKAWARAEGKRDEDIFGVSSNPTPTWPWRSGSCARERLEEITGVAPNAPVPLAGGLGKAM